VRSLRRLQSLQQLVKRLVVLYRVLVPAAEITDDFADDIRLAFVFRVRRFYSRGTSNNVETIER